MKPLDEQTLSLVQHKESQLDFEAALWLALSSDNEETRRAIESSNEKDIHPRKM